LPDSLQEFEDTYTLFWERENLMPEEDFVVHYHNEPDNKLTHSNNDAPKDKSNYTYLRLTPFVIPGVAVGYTRRIRLNEEGAIDFTLAANYHLLGESHKTYGLSLISEHFDNSQAVGFFFRANVGAEYGSSLRFFDENPQDEKRWFPNVTVGLGYSIRIFSSPYLRLSAEVGVTLFIGRINCELLF